MQSAPPRRDSDDERVKLAIEVLRRLADGDRCSEDLSEAEELDVLAATVSGALVANRIRAREREVLFLRGRLLNSLLFGRSRAASGAISPLMVLDAPGEFDLCTIFDLPEPWALLKVLSLLTTFPVLTEQGASRREALLGNAKRLEELELPKTWPSAVLLSWAWMFCSYAARADRHSIKPVLNAIARRWLTRAHVQVETSTRRFVERPRLVVVAEVLKSGHVQYRYFARYLRQLRSRFEVVIAAPAEQLDISSRQLADKVVELRITEPGDVASAARAIQNATPDIVFWPSVGMATWGPFLANLRFAPIQLSALGHSASTFSPMIDYFLTEEGYVADSSLFSETLLLVPDDSLKFEPSPAEVRPAPRFRPRPSPLRIAVPSNALKLNPHFLDVLGTIDRAVSRSIRFIFFPNCRPTQTDALTRALTARVRLADVIPRVETNAYLNILADCDVALSSFPFGGLHSTIDALLLGLPVVALQGQEPHARTDSLVIRRLGLPDWLVAQTEQDYVRAALRVITDDEERLSLGQAALAANPWEKFFGSYPSGLERDRKST